MAELEKYMRSFIVAAIVLCGLLFFASYAQAAQTADPAANAVQKHYAGLKSMRAEFTQVLTHQESGAVENRAGVLYFATPLNVRWETERPIPEVLLITPEAIWNAFPDEDMAYKYPANLSEDSGAIVRVVTGQSNLDKDFIIENKGTKEGITTLLLYPQNPTQSMTEAELVVEAKTGVIKQVTIVDFFNNRNAITFTAQEINPEMDDNLFTFTPAKGMKVEDRTQDGSLTKPLMQ